MPMRALAGLFLLVSGLVSLAATPADVPNPRPCARHDQKVAAARKGGFDVVLVGDSITHTLGDHAAPRWAGLRAVWQRHLAPRKALNLGHSGYRTEDILWNLQDGELEFPQSPKVFVLLIGTNNTDDQHYKEVHTAEQLAAGTKAIVDLIRKRHPTSKVLILRPFPCGAPSTAPKGAAGFRRSAAAYEALRKSGDLTSRLADTRNVFWLEVGKVFLKPDGTIDPALMPDLIHPGAAGAEAWVKAILPTVDKLLGGSGK